VAEGERAAGVDLGAREPPKSDLKLAPLLRRRAKEGFSPADEGEEGCDCVAASSSSPSWSSCTGVEKSCTSSVGGGGGGGGCVVAVDVVVVADDELVCGKRRIIRLRRQVCGDFLEYREAV